jgi:hypothetical protein
MKMNMQQYAACQNNKKSQRHDAVGFAKKVFCIVGD